MLATGDVLQGRYQIRDLVGKGGMGVVYRAADNRLGQLMVAVKEMDATQLAPADRQWAVDAFRQEARMLARLNHGGIARVMDYFSQGDYSYLVMEYVEGETLEAALARSPRGFSEQQALAWAGQLAVVLDYLHKQNPPIIFRDLKPGNIMVQTDGSLKLIDFGIARLFKPGQTHDTTLLGTPGYAAPEQYGRGQTDTRSDVYSMAVVVHQLLTGYDPALTPMRLPPVRQLRPELTPQLEAALQQALQLDPDQRYMSSLAFGRALGAPVSGWLAAESQSDNKREPPVGSPGWFKAAAAALLLLLIVLAGWFLFRGPLDGRGEAAQVADRTTLAIVTQIVTPTPQAGSDTTAGAPEAGGGNTPPITTPTLDSDAPMATREAELAARETEVGATATAVEGIRIAEANGDATATVVAFAATATVASAQMTTSQAPPLPESAQAMAVESFEYSSDDALASAFWTNGPGNDITLSRSSANAISGAYALELRYTMHVGASDYVGVERNFNAPMSWLNHNSICLWLGNDNFRGHMVLQFRERNGETWKHEIPLANRTFGDYCVSLSEETFFIAEFSETKNGRLDLEAIENIAFYLGAGGVDEGVLFLDNVRVIP